MENKKFLVLQVIYLVGLIFMLDLSLAVADQKEQSTMQTYIVWVKKPVQKFFAESQDLESWYESFLPETFAGSNQLKPQMVHMYRNVATGFAARLTPEGLKAMEKKQGFVSARPERILPLHTTHSPNFLGLHQGLGAWKGANYGEGVIIGVLDGGISPDHPSFSDEGVPPPPAKWKGKCEFNGTVCNNKLIGARNFQGGGSTGKPTVPPFDDEGHGTHTASTAAGNFVKGAGVFGMANGTATGMAPYAHLAIYKVCSEGRCGDSDILAALDAAVEDGVDVLSLSLGVPRVTFYNDAIAVGAFGAIQKGIFVSCSAGNSGPSYGSLTNEAPWILTVGASTIDRSIRATAKLGNDEEYDGESLFQPQGLPQSIPLVYAGAINNQSSPFCGEGQLSNVEGKIVLCERGGGIARISKGKEVKIAGGAAMILMNEAENGFSTVADAHVLPATHVSYAAGSQIKAYINSTSTPTATILFKGTVIGDLLAPKVASFSSRGPSVASVGILKPDIIGPGVNILAAWPVSVDNASVTSKATFNVISGTSMSCPHLSGIAALIKSSHPDWSPAAIKSAIMTTADVSNLGGSPIVDETLNSADLFATGAGHVNPSKVTDPGLVYDIKPEDYFPYLCGLNYTDSEIQVITQQTVKCSEVGVIPEAQLNYPSFSITFEDPSVAESQHYSRTVKNVGPANSTYNLDLLVPHKMGMSVNPSVLTFTEAGQEITFQVEFIAQDGAGKDGVPIVKGYLRWVSDQHSVSSPISVVFGS